MSEPPLLRYRKDLQKSGFVADPAQEQAVHRLQRLFDELCQREAKRERNFLRRLFSTPTPIQSVYFWGGVGRGKTYLMDCFYDALPFDSKMRTHFHRFMRRTHAELTLLKGQKNPLDTVAERLAAEAGVICFDEFFVSDITDAMILGNLLQALFARNVVLVLTSNIAPEGLYKDGLQRERFVPAIELLRTRADVIELDGGTDYRLRELRKLPLYHAPNDAVADKSLEHTFLKLIPDGGVVQIDIDLLIEGRPIKVHKECEEVAWFEFDALCDGPRSQHDYIVLAKEYHTVILSDVPQFGARADDKARRFIYLVDEFYDRRVKLILSAQTPLADLYHDGRLQFEFERTVSRLLEMQSEEYLGEPHRP